MRGTILFLSISISGCVGHASAETSSCGPASAAYIAESNAGCKKPDGGYFTEADGRVAPTLMVCTYADGGVFESWCE